MNYEEDIKIDETALDIECLEQADLMFKYARAAAEARKVRDKAKERMEVVRAEIDLDIRKNPDKYDLEKVTESAIQNTITTQTRYKKSVNEYLEAKHDAEIISGAVTSVDQRKSMIEALVKLHGQQYFAGPNVPRDLSTEREKKRKQSNKKVAQRMKRTR